ncbi:hypothetical protein BDC45DRAFT_540280 [Circinella umbellata]|nr:hypothetical protein BDC45DRAFT_540280 [Circinella umbellata]
MDLQNKDKWADSKKESYKILEEDILKNHTVESIASKLHDLRQTFNACFEFATYIHNDQESEPLRQVIRERVLNFDFYKGCRAAFGPPEYDVQISTSLDLLENHPEMFKVDKSKNTTENNHLARLRVSAGNNITRSKSGKYVSAHSKAATKTFKIDIRFSVAMYIVMRNSLTPLQICCWSKGTCEFFPWQKAIRTKMEKNAQHTLNSLESIEARRISIGGKFRRPTSPYKVTCINLSLQMRRSP